MKNPAVEDIDDSSAAKQRRLSEISLPIFDKLPPEILTSILRLVPPQQLLTSCTSVCHRFNSFINSPNMWNSYFADKLFDRHKFDSFMAKSNLDQLRQSLASPLFSPKGVSVVSDNKNCLSVTLVDVPQTLDGVVACILKRNRRPFEDKPYCLFDFREKYRGETSKMARWYSVNFRALNCDEEVIDSFQPQVQASGTSGTTRSFISSRPQAAALVDGEGRILDSFYLSDFDLHRSILFKNCPVGSRYLVMYSRHNPVVKFSIPKSIISD